MTIEQRLEDLLNGDANLYNFRMLTRAMRDLFEYTKTKGSGGGGGGEVFYATPINPSWPKWSQLSYSYGFDKNQTRIFHEFQGTVETDAMFSVRGGGGRWNSNQGLGSWQDGGHVFEGWNATNTYRLTIGVGKRYNSAFIQVFNPNSKEFFPVKIGSDEDNKGFDFGHNEATFYGNAILKKNIIADTEVVFTRSVNNGRVEFTGGSVGGTNNRNGGAIVLFGEAWNNASSRGGVDLLVGSYTADLNNASVRFQHVSQTDGAQMIATIGKNGLQMSTGVVTLARLSEAPTGTIQNGSMYYNTTTNKVMVRENGAWKTLTTE